MNMENLSPLEKMIYKEVRKELKSLIETEHMINETSEQLDRMKESLQNKGRVINEACKKFGFKVQEVPFKDGGPYKLMAHNDPNVPGVMFPEHRNEYVIGIDMSSAKDYTVVNALSEVNNGSEERGVIVEIKEEVAFVRMNKDGVVLPFDIKDLSIVND